MTTIWGNQIGLRPFEEPLSDNEVARVYRWSHDENLLRWSGGSPTDLSLEEFRERLRNDHREVLDQRIVFFIVTRANELIGRIGCFALDWSNRDGELGIAIGEAAEWSKGYGREAIILLLRHLFETTSLERVHLFTFPDNIRAQRCFAACGFRPLGTSRRFSPELGVQDGVEMEITRSEFTKCWSTRAPLPSAAQKCSGESSAR